MSFADFAAGVAAGSPPPAGLAAPLLGLWRDGQGDWAGAHAAVQASSSRDAAWVHAYLHRKEGDDANAAYWYSRAGRPVPATSLDDEWRAIASALLAAGA